MLFPMMSEKELGELADDIAANGLIEPVVLYHGEVLDGRNRLAACELAGVEPHFAEVDGNVPSPTIYVLSKNLHRRHLTQSQKGAIAAEAIPMIQEETQKRRMSNLKNQEHTSNPQNCGNGSAASIAAKAVGVGTRTVESAIAVQKESPELFERIKQGSISADAAEAALPSRNASGNGTAPYEPKTDHQKKLAGGQKDRLVRGLSTITGLCRGLEELDIRKALSACDEEERSTWIERAKELASQLRAFSARLQKGF